MVYGQQTNGTCIVCRPAKGAISSAATRRDGAKRQSLATPAQCNGESATTLSHRCWWNAPSGQLSAAAHRRCSRWECATRPVKCATVSAATPDATARRPTEKRWRGIWTTESGYAEPPTRSGPESTLLASWERRRPRRGFSSISGRAARLRDTPRKLRQPDIVNSC
jgi:hypothetical protein